MGNVGGHDNPSGNKSMGNLGGHDNPFGIEGHEHIEQQDTSPERRKLPPAHKIDSPIPWPFNEPYKALSDGEEYQGKVTSYGQQLRYEQELRGWTTPELAKKLNTTVSEVESWETDHSAIEFASRQRLSQLLGNNFYLSSEVIATPDGTALKARIVQRQLIAQDFTTIISVLTEFHTQFRLIQQGRFADLAEYTQTQDRRFVEEANLDIYNLTSNSPALITLLTDPGTVTGVVTTTVTLAVALQKTVDAISKSLIQYRKDQLYLQKEELDVKRQNQEYIKSVFITTKEAVDDVWPNADSEQKAKMMQDMLPNWEKLLKELLR